MPTASVNAQRSPSESKVPKQKKFISSLKTSCVAGAQAVQHSRIPLKAAGEWGDLWCLKEAANVHRRARVVRVIS
ncbi:unnamed protein product [Toxocara canis]|uniref:Uncharacterized protein n=1 Tax=Toxocara canis TaxID=6265 RepID=A0A183UTN4_TOXCA|nr:unnamed protein product [Toxocara canis]